MSKSLSQERRVVPDPELIKRALGVLMDEVADELWFCDKDENLAMANKAALAGLGFRRVEDVTQPMQDWLARLEIFEQRGSLRLPEDAPLLRSLRGEVVTNFEEVLRHPKTGELLHREVYSAPIRDGQGEILGSVAMVRDITERRHAETRLREHAERLDLAYRATGLAAWDWEPETGRAVWTQTLLALLGLPADTPPSSELFFSHVHPDDINRLKRRLAEAFDARSDFSEDFRIVRQDGTIRHLAGRGKVFADEADGPIRMIGINYDITQSKELEDRLQKLVGELNHRVKNVLNTVQAIAWQTMRHADSSESFQKAFEARIQAMATCHDVLVASGWQGASLHAMLDKTLAAHFREGQDEVRNDCPDVSLSPSVALGVTLMLHELATNAGKYGALSTHQGRIEVRCKLLDGDRLELHWSEIGGPGPAASPKKGFGMRLIETTVRTDLHGDVMFDFREEGLYFSVSFPLPSSR